MYGFPENLQLDDLLGSEVQQICLGPGDLQFRFGSGRHICVQGLVEVFDGEVAMSAWDRERNWTNGAFQALLMKTIDDYAILNVRLLEISFEGGLRLRLHDDSTEFESLQIYPEHIIV